MIIEIKIPLEKRKSVLDRVRICVDCGSTRIEKNCNSIKCLDCGSVRYFVDPEKLFDTSLESREIH